MKKRILAIAVAYFAATFSTQIFAQSEADSERVSRWRFNAGLGVNSMRLGKDSWRYGSYFSLSTVKSASAKQGKRRYGLHLLANADLRLGRRWHLLGGLGLTRAQAEATRTLTYESCFFDCTTYNLWDTVRQEILQFDVPVLLRWHFIAEDNDDYNIKLFLETGLSLAFDLNRTGGYVRRELQDSDNVWFGGKIERTHPATPTFGVGMVVAKKFSLTLNWSGAFANPVGRDDFKFNSTMTRLTLSRNF